MRERVRVKTVPEGKSLTKQQSKDETDINLMIRRHGVIPPPVEPGRFVDVSLVGDYFDCMQIVARGDEAFAMLPAAVRKRFDNDPGALLRSVDAAIGDPEGHKELVEDLVKLEILAPEILDRFGIPVEPGDRPPAPASPSPAAPVVPAPA